MSWIKDTFFGGAAKDAARVQMDSLEKAMGIQRDASESARADILQMFDPAYQDLVNGFTAAQDQIAQGRVSTANIYNQATGQANQLLQQGTNASISALLGQPQQPIQQQQAQLMAAPQITQVPTGAKSGVVTLPQQPVAQTSGLRQPQSAVATAGTGIRPTGDPIMDMRGLRQPTGFENSRGIREATDAREFVGGSPYARPYITPTEAPQQQVQQEPQQTGALTQNIRAQQLDQIPVQNTGAIQMPDVSGIGLRAAEGAIIGGAQGAERALNQGFGVAQQQFQPYSEVGQQALQREAAMSGALGGDAQQQAIDSFMESPGQKYLREQAEQSLLRNASATGGLRGGSTLSALQEQAVGLSAQQQQQQLENLRSLAGRGQQAAGSTAGLMSQQGQALAGLRQGVGSQLGSLRMGVGQQVAGQMAGLGQAQAQNQLNLGSQLGNVDQTAMSNLSNLLQNQGQQGFSSRMQLAQILANLATGQGTNLSNLQSQIGTAAAGGITGAASGAAGGVGAVTGLISQLSDIRLKDDIKEEVKTDSYGIHSWTWKDVWPVPKHLRGKRDAGVLAQEVAQFNPNAVSVDASGYFKVNLGAL